ncbi:MAG TPA: response regulator, partial [Prolixibacteraceae bacterium]|nr:response regulator [Prolixibacteraceae bacterium]
LNGQRNINGSGIGLSICKDYTLLHNGVIMAQSNVGRGSCFTIQLPRKQKAQAILFESHQELKNLKETNVIRLNPNLKPAPDRHYKILVVEDNDDFRKFLIDFLEEYHQIEDANNGNEALVILKNKNIDLVVSDVMMPVMDGFEFCNLIKTQVETSHIPIILLTALSTTENLIVGLDKGADAYLTKPFDENVLLKQIENILEQRRRIRENFNKTFISQKTIQIGSLDNFFLNRVRSVVEKNIMSDNFSMESLAEELMLSRSQLHRKIKSISGSTTSEFVNLVRIKKAVELIENNNYRFNEVAYRVGFSNQPYFNKCFKKVYGVSPKEYFSEKINAYSTTSKNLINS